jgi:Domain of unknown function (DUF1857)
MLLLMRFEHAIDVNVAPDGDEVQPLTLAQVWQGLWMRAWCPDRLPNGPTSCVCTPLDTADDLPAGVQRLQRVLRFGAHEFHDTVEVEAPVRMRFTPKAHDASAPIGLTITISEPLAGQPRLTFVYEALAALSEEEALYSGYRQNAWHHMDHDMVSTWRLWLAQGAWPVDQA